MTGGHGKNEIILAESLHTCRGVYAPSEDRICSPIREKRCDGTEQASDLEMAALEFLPKANCAVRAGSIWLRRKLGRLEDDIGAGFFH
jgi:hypothetical protein